MSIRIMIVDDHAVFRSGLRALLEREEDFEVVAESGSGIDTLRMLDDTSCDVLLLDISMPGMSGTRVAEEALKKQPRVAVIALTMHEHEEYLRELFRLGARGYVLKKSTGTELVQAIRAAHRGDVYVDPAMASVIVSPFVGKSTGKVEGGRLSMLTPREREICRLLALGYTNAEVADKLFISGRTVETHRGNIMSKLELQTRAELVRFAIDNGLLHVDQ
jgi:two-component system, NarL family, response regulator NreC